MMLVRAIRVPDTALPGSHGSSDDRQMRPCCQLDERLTGDCIFEESGTVTGIRVLPSSAGTPKTEASLQSSGKLLGMAHTSVATYWSESRPDGSLYGEALGILTTADGAVATYTAQGVARPPEAGTAKWRGATYFYSSSPKLSQLNGVAIVFEYEVDAKEGKSSGKGWEWK